MKWLLRIALTLGVMALLAVGGLRLFAGPIGMGLYRHQVEARLGLDRRDQLPDGLHIGFCGTGSPLPDPTRAASCAVVIAGERVFIVDAGSGSTANLLLMGVPVGDAEALFLTHFHSDHISDLADMALQRWVGGARREPLPVIGPDGVEQVVAGFNLAYGLDHGYRTAHHGEAVLPSSGAGLVARPIGASREPFTVLDEGGVLIRAVAVDHTPVSPALAYRFDYGGRSLVISGDLDAEVSPGFSALAAGADLLVVEALQPAMTGLIEAQATAIGAENLAKVARDILDYHSTPEEAADAARAAGSDMLVLTHIVPALPSGLLHAAFLGGAPERFSGPIHIASDGDAVVLERDSDRVKVETWMFRG